ncbi:hypothetical protein DPM13_16910 [Paracoccus mutanolyticus]|uniref:Uncharacterized protein n=2 Tax=Paracoccus mutanolyticus TaxID=1499308 RepID=A0ABN5MBK0_9RHOB|nr:hypothetical protein DPM13_16910 [Paracoccus mutanolyticus]
MTARPSDLARALDGAGVLPSISYLLTAPLPLPDDHAVLHAGVGVGAAALADLHALAGVLPVHMDLRSVRPGQVGAAALS